MCIYAHISKTKLLNVYPLNNGRNKRNSKKVLTSNKNVS